MLRVRTSLGKSSIHGIGLFAAEDIKKGTVTWEFDSEFDPAYSDDQISRMPAPAQEIFWHYAYFDKELGKFVLCADDQRFINHTNGNTNIQSSTRRDVASQDIKKGEELLCNYEGFENGYFNRRKLDTSKFI